MKGIIADTVAAANTVRRRVADDELMRAGGAQSHRGGDRATLARLRSVGGHDLPRDLARITISRHVHVQCLAHSSVGRSLRGRGRRRRSDDGFCGIVLVVEVHVQQLVGTLISRVRDDAVGAGGEDGGGDIRGPGAGVDGEVRRSRASDMRTSHGRAADSSRGFVSSDPRALDARSRCEDIDAGSVVAETGPGIGAASVGTRGGTHGDGGGSVGRRIRTGVTVGVAGGDDDGDVDRGEVRNLGDDGGGVTAVEEGARLSFHSYHVSWWFIKMVKSK